MKVKEKGSVVVFQGAIERCRDDRYLQTGLTSEVSLVRFVPVCSICQLG